MNCKHDPYGALHCARLKIFLHKYIINISQNLVNLWLTNALLLFNKLARVAMKVQQLKWLKHSLT